MTEKEKRDAGFIYDANYDEALLKELVRTQDACFEYNSMAPGDPGRDACIRRILGKAGENLTIRSPFYCDYGYNIEIGDNFFSNFNVTILDGARVTFGDNVFIAPNCGFYTAGHPIDFPRRNAGLEYAWPIKVGDNVWFGAGVQVMPGVTIGSNVVIGAGSLVNKDIPDNVIAVGNPCRVLREITSEELTRDYTWHTPETREVQNLQAQTKNIFRGIEFLPHGQASDKLTEGCIVLEGGAFRGLYGEGVLDVLMEEGINFRTVIGTSAGALNGMNYVSGQIGRSARLNLTYRHDSRYVGMKAFRKNQGLIGFDFAYNEYEKIDPLNRERFFDPRRKYVAVTTGYPSGETRYFDRDECDDILQAIRASASMPFLSRPVEVEGEHFLDGGCSCKIAIDWALEHGYEKIVVVRTRDTAYRYDLSKDNYAKMSRRFYYKTPAFAEILAEGNEKYNELADRLDALHSAGRIFMIAPSVRPTVSRVESNMEKLGELYYLGYNDAREQLKALREYLK